MSNERRLHHRYTEHSNRRSAGESGNGSGNDGDGDDTYDNGGGDVDDDTGGVDDYATATDDEGEQDRREYARAARSASAPSPNRSNAASMPEALSAKRAARRRPPKRSRTSSSARLREGKEE